MSNEILNLAYALESQGIAFYENFSDKDEIFSQILTIKNSGLTLLKDYAQNNNLALGDGIDLEIVKPEDPEDALIKAINYELELNAFYERASDSVEDDILRDICFRLWATSHNEYVPALKTRLKQIWATEKNETEEKNTEEKNLNVFDADAINQMSETIDKFASGKATNEDLAALLKSPNASFLGGLALGGLAAMILNKTNENQTNKE
nr:aminotransferase [uncultured Campylobacter sp.]